MFAFIFHCRSFLPCWPLAFLIFSPQHWIWMFFFLQNSSPLFLVTFSSSFSVIHVSVNVKNNAETEATLLLFFLSKSLGGHVISFHIKPELRLGCHTCWLSYFTLVYLWSGRTGGGRVGGRSVGRCTVTWSPNFLGWVDYRISLAMGLRRSAVRGARLYINLGKTFLRISRIRNIFLTWILARVFVYLPPFIPQIPDFICWTVLILNLIYFEWRDTENQQYNERSANLQPCQRPCYSFSRIPSKWKWRKNNPLLDTSFLFSTKNPNDPDFWSGLGF